MLAAAVVVVVVRMKPLLDDAANEDELTSAKPTWVPPSPASAIGAPGSDQLELHLELQLLRHIRYVYQCRE